MKQDFNDPKYVEWRRSKITASNVAAIMGHDPWKGPLDVYLEMVEGKTTPKNEAMERGTLLEPYARQLYEAHTGIAVVSDVVDHPDNQFLGASLDGISFDHSTIVELKCPGTNSFENMKSHGIPYHYWIQVQAQLFCVPQAKLAHFFAALFNEGDLVDKHFEVIHRDPKFHVELFHACQDFWNNHIVPKIPPAPKYEKITDEEYLSMEARLQKIREIKKKVEEEEEELEVGLKRIADGRQVEGLLTRITTCSRKGTIDEAEMSKWGINVDNFRKPSKSYQTVSFIKKNEK